MVSCRGVSALVCVVIGVGSVGSVLRNHGGDSGALVTVPDTPAVVPAAKAAILQPTTLAEIDTALPTGAIGPDSALHAPNSAAYADAAKQGSSLILAGAEAINYLAGNTLRREGSGQPLHFTYFAWRGFMGDGVERSFTVRPWDRDQPELCEPGPDGAPLCRTLTILLDGKYEFPGARLGTVTLAVTTPRAGVTTGPETAVLVEGNVLHVPNHIPFLDSSMDAATTRPPASHGPAKAKGTDVLDRIVGRPAIIAGDTDRSIVIYAKDNRRLELQPVGDGAGVGRAMRVTVGHWRATKGTLCQTRVIGDSGQACFKPEILADGSIRLMPAGKAGEPQTLTTLPETGPSEVAED